MVNKNDVEKTVTDRSDLVRLSVNMNQKTADALVELADSKGISYTEAVRRAISVYYYLDNEARKGRRIITSDGRTPDGVYTDVVEIELA